MDLFFINPGAIDIDLVTSMGVNVKPDNDSAIGRFGTGLKYAISTLLREGCSVEICTYSRDYWDSYSFSTCPRTIRGHSFDFVLMNDQRLAYTTDLGKDWHLWMAYRELFSNMLDERGQLCTSKTEAFAMCEAWPEATLIHISGRALTSVYTNREHYFPPFSSMKPVIETPRVAAYRIPGGGSKNTLYNQGIQAGGTHKNTRLMWNIKSRGCLTEDRTLINGFSIIEREIAPVIPTLTDPYLLELFCFEDNLILESCLVISGSNEFFSLGIKPSTEFMDFVRDNLMNPSLRKAARQAYYELGGERKRPEQVDLSDRLNQRLDTAIAILKRFVNRDLTDHITVVDSIPSAPGQSKILASAMLEDQQISITLEAIERGLGFTIATLYEEYLHAFIGLEDETREMQNQLFSDISYFLVDKYDD